MIRRGILIALLGLAWPGAADAGSAAGFGVYEGNGWTGRQALAAFSSWFGHDPKRVIDFLDQSSWEKLDSDAAWCIPAWKGYALALSVPLTVAGTPLSDVAAGRHDASFAHVAQLLVANGQADAVVRLGWEANGSWYPWAAAPDPEAYKAAFRHVVAVMRAAPGAHFRFDWTTAQSTQQIPPPGFYPGDDVVDIVGQDIYAQTWPGPVIWPVVALSLNRNHSLDWLPEFAKAHGKPISIPEWGTGDRPDGHGLGDSARFVHFMAGWIRDHDVAYSDYWDYPASDYNAKVSDGHHPEAGAALKQEFGGSRSQIP